VGCNIVETTRCFQPSLYKIREPLRVGVVSQRRAKRPDRNKRDLHLADSERLGAILGRCECDLRKVLDELVAREQQAAPQRTDRA